MIVRVGANLTDFESAMGTVSQKLAKVDRDANKAFSGFDKIGGRMKDFGSSLTLGISLPLAAGAIAATKFATDLNASMANVASLIPGNTARVLELRTSVQDLAIATGKSTGDIAGGLYQVVSAFGDTADTAKILDINARAATAGLATTTDAINLTSAVTKGYGDTSAEAVQKSSDLAFVAVKLGQTTFPELAGSMGRVVPLAAALGVSQEELFGVMATGTGVTGTAAEVSTQLRGVLQSLLAPTKDMSGLLESMGIESGKALLEQQGLKGAMETVVRAAEATGKPLQKYVSQIEAQTLLLALAGPQADTFSQKLDAMGKAAGATDEAFKEQTQGINAAGFTMQQVATRAQVMAEKFGNALAPALNIALNALQPLLGAMESAVTWFSKLPEPIQTTIVGFAALAAAIGPLIFIAGQMITSFAAINTALIAIRVSYLVAAAASVTFSTAMAALKGAVLLTAAAVLGWKLGEWAYEQIPGVKAVGDAFADLLLMIPGVEFVIDRLTGVTSGQKTAAEGLAFATEKLEKSLASKGIVVEKAGKTTEQYAAELREAAKQVKSVDTATGKGEKKQEQYKRQIELTAEQIKKLNEAAVRNQKATEDMHDRYAKFATDFLSTEHKLATVTKEFENSQFALATTFAKAQNDMRLEAVKTVDIIVPASKRIPETLRDAVKANAELEAAYRRLGVTSSVTLTAQADQAMRDYATIRDSGTASARDIELAWVKMERARIEAARAAGEAVSQAHIDDLQKIEDRLTGSTKKQKDAWGDMTKEVSTVITNFTQDIAKSLFDGEMSWGEKTKAMLKSLGAAVVSSFIQPATTAIAGFISGVLKDLLSGKGLGGVLDSIKGIGSAIGGIFGGGASVAGGAAGAAGSVAGGAASVGGSVASAAGSAASLANPIAAVAGVGSLISGVVGNFQMAGMNKTLDLIERYTRFAEIHLGHILEHINAYLPGIADIHHYLWTVQQPALAEMIAELQGGVQDRIREVGRHLQDVVADHLYAIRQATADTVIGIRDMAKGGRQIPPITINIQGNVIGNREFANQIADAVRQQIVSFA